MNTDFATIDPSKQDVTRLKKGIPLWISIPDLERKEVLLAKLPHCFLQIKKTLQEKQLPAHIVDNVYFPWGEDQSDILSGQKLMTQGASLDIEKFSPPETTPGTFAFREKLHLRQNSFAWLQTSLSTEDWSFLSHFFSLLNKQVARFEHQYFKSDLSESYENQFLFIHYSQQSESYNALLHSQASSTFGNIHEDETLFSFHIAESQPELQVFDYDKHQWRVPTASDHQVQILLGQNSRKFDYCPTPHRLEANTNLKVKSRFSFIVERVPRHTQLAPTSFRPELLRFKRPEIREKLTAFVFWDTFYNGYAAPPYILNLTEDLARLHLYFLIKNDFKKLVRYENGRNTFQNLERQGFKYALCVRPGFMIKCENVVEELLNLALTQKEKYFIHHYHKELREGVSLALLGNGRGEAIDVSISQNGLLKTLFEFPNDHVDQLQTKILSHSLPLSLHNMNEWSAIVENERIEIQRHLQGGFSSTFIFNTEGYQDIIKSQLPTGHVQTVGFASGFKLNFICEKYQSVVKKISFVDANKNSLKLKHDFFTNWNGTNFNDWFLNYWQNRFPIYEKDPLFLNQRWSREIELWGGATEFYNHWQWFQKQKVSFQELDVIADVENFKSILDPDLTVIFWASNLWHNEFVSYLYSHVGVGTAYLNWLKKLNSIHPRILLYQDDVPHGATWIRPNNKWVSQILKEYDEL